MSKYPASQPEESAELRDSASTADLEFPIEPDFLSLPPDLDPHAMVQRSHESLQWRNSRPGEAERRLALN